MDSQHSVLTSLLSAVLVLIAVCVSYAEEFRITIDGNANAWIQHHPSPSAHELTGAIELQKAIERISGAHVARKTYPGPFYRAWSQDPEKVEILLATLEDARAMLPEKNVRQLENARSSHAFLLLSIVEDDGKHLYIVGKGTFGVLYGAYTFIEDYLGARFFHAGEGGEVWPSASDMTLGDIDDFREPWCEHREISAWQGSVSPIDLKAFRSWLTRRKCTWWYNHAYKDLSRDELDFASLGRLTCNGGGHGTFAQAVPDALFAAHPEYFPLKGGKRVCEERSQRCLSSPEVQKMLEDFVVEFTRTYDADFTIMYHDSIDGWCSCENCVKMGTDDNGNFSIAALAFRFSNLIAERVYKRNPVAKLGYYMYSQYREIPACRDFKLDKRMLGTFCVHQRCYAHSIADEQCELNQSIAELFQRWKKHGTKLGIFEYVCISKVNYAPLEYMLARDMKYYRDNGVSEWIEDCTCPVEIEGCQPLENWQYYYAASKLMWDADLDVEKLMDEAYSIYYGVAAVPMKKYHALRRELWEKAPSHSIAGWGARYASCLLDETTQKTLLDFLVEGEALAKGDEMLRKRLALDRKFLTEYWSAEAEKLRKAALERKIITVSQRVSEVKIDGVLDEKAWEAALPLTSFEAYPSKGVSAEETIVKILYDENGFYLGIEAKMEHAWSAPLAKFTQNDENIFEDDSVESFFSPAEGVIYQLVLNTNGALYDAKGYDRSWSSGVKSAVKTGKTGYIAELFVPCAPMSLETIDPASQKWNLHFLRSCHNLQPPNSSAAMSIDAVAPHAVQSYRKAELKPEK